MMFDTVNYPFLLQDFLFAMAAGFGVAFINQLLSAFFYRGRLLFVKDLFVCFIFAVAVFSYVVSFANYPVVRIYHIIAAFMGFLSFNIPFSIIFQKISKKICEFLKRKMLCLHGKIKSTVCVVCQKITSKNKKDKTVTEERHLKNGEHLVYNL